MSLLEWTINESTAEAADNEVGNLITAMEESSNQIDLDNSGAMDIVEEVITRYPYDYRHEYNQVLVTKILQMDKPCDEVADRCIIIDSGASSHCIPWRDWFTSLRNHEGIAQLGTDQEIDILGFGDTNLFKHVLFIPDLRIGIISTG